MLQTQWAQRLLARSRTRRFDRSEPRSGNAQPLSFEGQPPPFLSLLQLLVRQWRTERRVVRSNGVFRTTDAELARRSYDGMSACDFESINAAQEWANWRLIPRLFASLPRRPLTIVDLGCGTGGSTSLLALHAPIGSAIKGFDAAPNLLQRARRRRYANLMGAPIAATFVCQSIAETLRRADGTPLRSASVDLVHASGVVGHHLDADAVDRLAAETARLLAPGAAAVLDAGPKLRRRRLVTLVRPHGLRAVQVHRLCPLNPRAAIVFVRL